MSALGEVDMQRAVDALIGLAFFLRNRSWRCHCRGRPRHRATLGAEAADHRAVAGAENLAALKRLPTSAAVKT